MVSPKVKGKAPPKKARKGPSPKEQETSPQQPQQQPPQPPQHPQEPQSQMASQVFRARTPAHHVRLPAHLRRPSPATPTRALEPSQDLFATEELDVGSLYSQHIPTPGSEFAVEGHDTQRDLPVVTLEHPTIHVPEASPSDDSDDDDVTQDAQDQSAMEEPPPDDDNTQQEEDVAVVDPMTLGSGADDDETTDDGTAAGKTRSVTLSKRVEGEIAEWLQDNPFLYDRGHQHYKNRAKKTKAMEDKAKELGITKDDLARWIHTKRTRYGKLTRKVEKSGIGQVTLTSLDKWILKLFAFMAPHIVRHREPRTLGIGQVRQTVIFH